MKSFTCTNILKDTNNQVISYELQDSAGKAIQVSSKKLKLMLENNKIEVVNLLIENNEIVEDPNYQLKSMVSKLKMFGKAYKSDCGHEYYVIESSDTTIVYIPDDVKYLVGFDVDDDPAQPDFCNISCNTLKVIGGSGLTSAFIMFAGCKAKSLDLSSFDTSRVTDMDGMFDSCKVQSLDLSSFNTSNVKTMENMFFACEVQSLDLSSFNTSNVTSMSYMFHNCEAQSINLSSFDTSNVTYMDNMFESCKAQVTATDRKILEELHKR